MATVNKSFTAVGVSDHLLVRNGESFTYSVSGTFVGTVQIERSDDGTSWSSVESATGAESGTIVVNSANATHTRYRVRCSAFTSGTIVTSIADVDTDVIHERTVRNRDGVVLQSFQDDGIAVQKRVGVVLQIPAAGLAKVGGVAGWVVAAADNVSLVTLPASQSGSKAVIPVVGLRVGDTITAFSVVGQIESGSGQVTLDADLRKHTAAASDVADASVGAITQIDVTADTIVNHSKAGLSEVVAADESFYVLLTGTTAGSTDIAIQGVTVTVNQT